MMAFHSNTERFLVRTYFIGLLGNIDRHIESAEETQAHLPGRKHIKHIIFYK